MHRAGLSACQVAMQSSLKDASGQRPKNGFQPLPNSHDYMHPALPLTHAFLLLLLTLQQSQPASLTSDWCMPIGRDSPAFPSDTPSHSSGQGQSYHQSVSEAPSQSRDSGQAPDDGQAEDLVSDVQSRAQDASQSAVIAGQEQQQKVLHCPLLSHHPAPSSTCHIVSRAF